MFHFTNYYYFAGMQSVFLLHKLTFEETPTLHHLLKELYFFKHYFIIKILSVNENIGEN